jgi:hypothetical protein
MLDVADAAGEFVGLFWTLRHEDSGAAGGAGVDADHGLAVEVLGTRDAE